MRSILPTFTLTTALAVSLVACASEEPFDELAGETAEDEALDGKADASIDGAYTFFAIRGDARRCAYPQCGGFFIERVNRTTTKCHDGATDASCYTPDLDWSESGLAVDTQTALTGAAADSAFASQGIRALVRGRFAPQGATQSSLSMGRFVVTEAWIAEGNADADGVFVRVQDAGVRCISSPCENLVEKGLNTSRTAAIAGLDFSTAGLTDDQLGAIDADLFTPHGVVVAGSRYMIRENGRTARGRTATVVYRRLETAPAAAGCFVGGCSSQICSEQEGVVSTCEWREEYACYQTASCERQTDGTCGWTQSAELTSCLASQ